MKNKDSFKVIPFPKHRDMLADLANLTPKHYIQGLVEFDVTEARKFFQIYREEKGERLSFTGWLIKCIGQAVSEYKHIQAYRKGKKLIIFDDVDVGLTIEREVKGRKIVTGYIVRKANEKNVFQIHKEIRAAQEEEKIDGALVGEDEAAQTVARIQFTSRFLRRMVIWWYRGNILRRKKTQGTVGITSIGMFGNISGWPLVLGPYPLFFGIGSITKKPMFIGNDIEPREFLQVCIMFDHNSVDGADATRFIIRLNELLKEGFGLN
ncbi:MAG: 2-oxo acid dehydrogenase subunit E2 [Promethearchaeota archaeon]